MNSLSRITVNSMWLSYGKLQKKQIPVYSSVHNTSVPKSIPSS